MTVEQLAQYLRVSPGSLRRSMNRGDWQDMPHHRVGKRGDHRFRLNEVMDYLERKFN